MTSMAKSMKRISTTGRQPTKAAPTAMPVKDASAMGVSTTRRGPYFCTRPSVTL
jgi:hypothetical protein